ncbi:S53 family peptidase [Catenulispora pinistramenti]|uniref:S53 family peptidase n=1 Tax=Catenulispora pinistramenti TaxID=2705254 RepID=UPI001E578E7C|nr:S53 family peptidase [Catenulispora pinistramenti]
MRRILLAGAMMSAVSTAAALACVGPAEAAPAPQVVPAACASAIAGHAHCNALQLVRGGARPAAPAGFGPSDIQSAYNLGSNPGSGQTVAIVDAYDDPNAESDLGTYRSQWGLSACTTANGCFTKVDQSGGSNYPTGDSGWGVEITLDLDAVSAACPGCHILLVEANTNNDTDLGAAVDEAVKLGAKFVSNSYSDAESNFSTGLDSHYNHPGVMIAAATGDSGTQSGSNAQFPATFPSVVAVGGTSLSKDSSSRGWSESVWSSGGSGCSSLFAKPAYQQNISTGCDNRASADVSADADPNTGLAVYDTYSQSGWLEYGGTSLATPLISAMWAQAGAPASGDNGVSYVYANEAKFNDVTSGSNGSCGTVICNAGTGWDGPTGVGTPNGVSGFAAGNTPPPPSNDFSVSLSPASGSVNPGSSATATVGTKVTAGSAVTVQLSASGLPSGASASFSPTSVSAGGSSTLTISTSGSTPAGTYPVTVTGSAGSTTHTATYSLTVNGSGGGGTVTVTDPGDQFGFVGFQSNSLQIQASDSKNLPLTFSATGLPPGLSISSSGDISGTPTTAGTYQVTVTATDSGGGSGKTAFGDTVYGF